MVSYECSTSPVADIQYCSVNSSTKQLRPQQPRTLAAPTRSGPGVEIDRRVTLQERQIDNRRGSEYSQRILMRQPVARLQGGHAMNPGSQVVLTICNVD